MLRQAYDEEMTEAANLYNTDALDQAFAHLERAHILGQSFPIQHAKTHWRMLKVGWRRRDFGEITGQTLRIVGSLLFSRIWNPTGNTGGAHVSPFKSMPIPTDLQTLLDKYGRGAKA